MKLTDKVTSKSLGLTSLAVLLAIGALVGYMYFSARVPQYHGRDFVYSVCIEVTCPEKVTYSGSEELAIVPNIDYEEDAHNQDAELSFYRYDGKSGAVSRISSEQLLSLSLAEESPEAFRLSYTYGGFGSGRRSNWYLVGPAGKNVDIIELTRPNYSGERTSGSLGLDNGNTSIVGWLLE